jgi:hypothetical protein
MLSQYLFIHAYPIRVTLTILCLLRFVRPVRPDGRRQLLHLRKQGWTCLDQVDCNFMIFYAGFIKLKVTVQRDGPGRNYAHSMCHQREARRFNDDLSNEPLSSVC